MNIQIKTTIQFLFYISILSIFIINSNVYPIIFGFFVISTNILLLYNGGYAVKKWTLLILSFLFWGILIYIIQNEYSSEDLKMLSKMIVNLLFFFTVINSGEKIIDDKFWKRTLLVFEVIIVLSFVQYMYLYYKLDLFSLIVHTADSMTAYKITENPQLLFWGNYSKNILATKIILAQICYFYIVINKFKFTKKNMLLLILSVCNAILCLSRTAQLTYFGALGIYILFTVIKSKKTYIKVFAMLPMVLGFCLLFVKIDDLLRINFDITDGGYIRLIYWNTFLDNFLETSYFIGNGLLSTANFLSRYSYYYIGENNMHNVFLNMLLDFGFVGTSLYVLMLISYYRSYRRISAKLYNRLILIFSWFAVTSLQYVGYDNDLIVFLIIIYLVHINPLIIGRELTDESFNYRAKLF
ncbi:O-antigen ligase family protein [Bacillus cereus group sp. N6]|uniref:O-antigen ligase family protein n=1 Tax=Bacillus cereus group sp. N6 TaxID=2794583 RepID=UPI0018F388B0|nr:O-antigen ligase family protein [Bacillus cereus group sp. N6]MBJ8111774.1 O-antigen ligase family protein [Bacillus cereus group sp. N6]